MKDWKDNSYHKKTKEDTSKTNTVSIKIPRYIILFIGTYHQGGEKGR